MNHGNLWKIQSDCPDGCRLLTYISLIKVIESHWQHPLAAIDRNNGSGDIMIMLVVRMAVIQ